jgi:hypothetical protein
MLKAPDFTQPISGVSYETLSVVGDMTDRPAPEHADLNLALRSYERVDECLTLVDYGGMFEPLAPQLSYLFADRRLPTFSNVYSVYDWDWSVEPDGQRGELIADWPVTLVGMETIPGEIVHVPDGGYDIGGGYDVLVLYATEERITLKYTREDNVVYGYTIHIEDVYVEPSLLALYDEMDAAGRGELPALRGGQPLGRARGNEICVAVRDTGSFMDPRCRKDWWQDFMD